MIPIYTKEAQCNECYKTFTTHYHDDVEVCTSCRSMKALERIAEAIETWMGWQ
jgi:rRNA maturation endonuclease Nob1